MPKHVNLFLALLTLKQFYFDQSMQPHLIIMPPKKASYGDQGSGGQTRRCHSVSQTPQIPETPPISQTPLNSQLLSIVLEIANPREGADTDEQA